jgi:hypothetical protein
MTDPIIDQPATPPENSIDRQSQLRELTAQSWNLELVISGAALFATLGLAQNLDEVLDYYRYNLMPDDSYFHDILPVQVVSLIKAACYVLFVGFLANFVMRAFWVALVGLLAIFPAGVRYEHIPSISDYARQRYARKMGSLNDFIIRLDQRCNAIFALAGMVALMFLAITVISLLSILVGTVLQWALPPDTYKTVIELIGYVAMGILGLYLLLVIGLSLPTWRNNPRVAPLAFSLSNTMYWILPGVGKLSQFISFTFMSNVPKKLYYQRAGLVFLLFIIIEMVTMMTDLFNVMGLPFDSRAFMSLSTKTEVLATGAYDNLRPETNMTDQASIQADVIREPFLRLFVAYPKQLDQDLTRRFREPIWPDSLRPAQVRKLRAPWQLKVLNQYFRVYVNDSLYRQANLLFVERPGNNQRGLTTVLLTPNLIAGRNTLRIMAPDSANKLQPYATVPFWYVPEK